MKTANWTEGSLASNNYSQFSAEPAGYYNYDLGVLETFRAVGDGAYFWTNHQSSHNPFMICTYCLNAEHASLILSKIFKTAGYSVRCVKD
jgi:uncharacterized protein (TIGR02145 family)